MYPSEIIFPSLRTFKRGENSYKSINLIRGKRDFELLVELGFLAEWTTVSNRRSRYRKY